MTRHAAPSLREALVAHGGAVAESLAPAGGLAPSELAAALAEGPRAGAAANDYGLLLDMILEGSRLHYGGARVLAVEPDLGLLLGDQLYALGLQRLATLGDLDAVRELADVISLVAQAQAEGDPERAEAAWAAGVAAVGWGSDRALADGKARAREGVATAAEELRCAAENRRVQALRRSA